MSETAASIRRFSDRKRKSSAPLNDVQSLKKNRYCDKAGCLLVAPICCLQANEACCVSGYTSRWYHMSLGEHYCNNCFDNYYRAGKTGHQHYSSWSHQWGSVSRASKPTIKRFVATELLPYWLKCMDCGKWRALHQKGNLSYNFIKSFKCSEGSKDKDACDIPEESAVADTDDPSWMMQLVEEPLLKNSPASSYLKRFLPEDVGMSPTDNLEPMFKSSENIEPFYVGQCGESPIWVKPDELEEDETQFAKSVLLFPPCYLGVRNLIVTVWHKHPQWLTIDQVEKYIVCRGLVRICLVRIAEKIIKLLTKKGVINYGVIESPEDHRLFSGVSEKIIVVGAGISGLAAAKHLKNLGLDVTVLEAKSYPFGRSYQNSTICSDANFVQGLTNNPFTIMAVQAKKHIQVLENSFIVFREDGEQIPFSITERVDHELYGLIHGAIEYATLKNKDSNWYDTIINNYKEISKMALTFCDQDAFQLFFNQFGIEQRADLKELSLLSWEFITPLMGNDGIVKEGFDSILQKLAENLTIEYNVEVTSIDYSSDKICVKTDNGTEYIASQVLITVPVFFLRSDGIQFNPPLPLSKTKALEEIGDYFCEKLIMEFPKRFWTRKIKEPFGKFSIVSPGDLFFLFIDITLEKKNSPPTLMTYIQKKSLQEMKDITDEAIVRNCMTLLRKVFARDGMVSEPTKYLITHWSEDKYGGSYGSFVKVNGTQNCFDELAKTVDSKLFFAGEATFRNMPSTVSGAYLSGIREAQKIIKCVENV